MQINIEVPWKFISTLWASTFTTRLILSLMNMIKHSQFTESNNFVISLHLKKEVRNEGHFWHADKRQSFYKLVLSFLVEVATHVQNTQNRKLVIFLQYIKKIIVATALQFIVMQNIQIFYGVPVIFVAACWKCEL